MAATKGSKRPAKGPVRNRRSGFEVDVQQTFEAGLVLSGDEIKSIRAGRVQLLGGYVRLLRGAAGASGLPEAIVIGIHLGLAERPDRSRRLLLHARELRQLDEALRAKGQVAVPLSLYLKRGWAKLSVGVGRSRRQYDKRQLLKRRDSQRQQEAELKRLGKA